MGIDHVAITVADVEAATAFYDTLFGVRVNLEHSVDGRVLVRQIALGSAVLSLHQHGNGLDLVAARPEPGTGDICFRWSGTIQSAVDLLRTNGIEIVEGPAPRRTAGGHPSQSVYFRDLDHNLIELMA